MGGGPLILTRAETSGRAAAREAAHSPAAETSGHASAASAVEAMTSHKGAGSMVASSTDGTVTETDFSSVFRSTATAITTMIMDTAVAAGCIEEQSIPAARIGGAATNSA